MLLCLPQTVHPVTAKDGICYDVTEILVYAAPVSQIPLALPHFQKPLWDTSICEGECIILVCIISPYPEPEKVQHFVKSSTMKVH